MLIVLLAALLGFLPASGVRADDSHVVRIESFSFPPLLHLSKSGQFSGTMGETVKALCEAAGMTCDFTITPLSRAYHNLRTGESHALITIDVNQLNDCCVTSDWASPWTAGFFTTQDQSAIPQNQDDLIGKSLIVVHGMKSPYQFAKDLDKLAADKLVALSKAPNILSSVRMLLSDRAPLLWGGEDFKWYIGKLDPEATYLFEPKIEIPVVIWTARDHPEITEQFNEAFEILTRNGDLDDKNLLRPAIMKERYHEAPLP